MTSPAGSASVDIIGDVSRFARQVQNDLASILRRVRVDPVEVRGDFDQVQREARQAGDDVSDAFERSGEQAENSLDEIGRAAAENADDVEREFERSGEEVEDALDEVGDKGEREFDRIEREAKDSGRSMRRVLVGAAVAIGAAFAVLQIGQFLKDATLAAQEANSVMANTVQIIESTGEAAGLTAQQVADLAGELSLKIGVDDEEVQSAANVLLTFKNVSEETFGSALGLAADLSSVLGTDLQGATLQLGKALNDPVKGITSLSRAGVQFTEQQKEQIKALVESGDVLGAQNVILGELEGQLGGTAAASADSTAKIAVAFDALKEALGGPIITAIDQIAPALIGLFESLEPLLESLGGVLGGLAEQAVPIVEVLGAALAEGLDALLPAIEPIGSAFLAVVEALAPLLPVLGELLGTLLPPLAEILEAFAEPLAVMAELIADGLTQALVLLEPHLPQIVDLFTQFATVMAENMEETLPIIIELLLELLVAILPLIPDMIKLAEAMLPIVSNSDGMVLILTVLSHLILAAVLPAIKQMSALMKGDLAGAFPVVTFHIRLLRDVIRAVFGFIGDFVGVTVNRVVGTLGQVRAIAFNVIGWFGDMLSGSRDRLGRLISFVGGLPGKIRGAIGNLGSILINAGRQIIDGLIQGIRDGFGRVQDTLGNLTSLLPDWKGPAERDRAILRESGRFVLQGFQRGIEDERDNLMNQLQDITDGLSVSATATAQGRTMGSDGASANGRVVNIENLNLRALDNHWSEEEMIRTLERSGVM